MPTRRHIAFSSAAFGLALAALLAQRPAPPPLRTTTLVVGGVSYRLEVAETSRSRARGLSGRAALANDGGMLFVFRETGRHTFWMKDMRFPIDILWLDERWCVVESASHVRPDSYPARYGLSPSSRYAVELPAGTADAQGVAVGRCFEPPRM